MDAKTKLSLDGIDLLEFQKGHVSELDLSFSERRILVNKSRRRNVTMLSTMLAVMPESAPPGFLATMEAMMGSPYRPPVFPQPEELRIANLSKAEAKRQRRLERNKRNRPIRGCYDA